MDGESAATSLYGQLIDGWNTGDAKAVAATISPHGLVIGFDGSQMLGRDAVADELGQVFADHETATYVTKVRSVRELVPGAALLHAVAGMVPPGGTEVIAERNSIQTVVVQEGDHGWSVVLFQNTPARFDGRSELSEALTAELNELIPG